VQYDSPRFAVSKFYLALKRSLSANKVTETRENGSSEGSRSLDLPRRGSHLRLLHPLLHSESVTALIRCSTRFVPPDSPCRSSCTQEEDCEQAVPGCQCKLALLGGAWAALSCEPRSRQSASASGACSWRGCRYDCMAGSRLLVLLTVCILLVLLIRQGTERCWTHSQT
jgi:hypothetical protein